MGAVPESLFGRDLLPDLLQLRNDRVPNIRIGLAETLRYLACEIGFIQERQATDQIDAAMKFFCTDSIQEVRYIAGLYFDQLQNS